MSVATIPAAHAVATLFMAGVIWFVQLVHYPLFASARVAFPAYEVEHQRRTTWVVAPPMLVELVTACLLVIDPPPGPPALPWSGLALLVLIWISTAVLQVPAHRRLSQGFDPAAAGRLVATNWIRTVAWTLRVPLALAML